jgi:itaconyl-CoA hydratase
MSGRSEPEARSSETFRGHELQMASGRFYEDFSVGDTYRHPLGRTITASDNAWFSLITMNTNQLHFNDHYARQSPFQQQLVNSGLSVAMVLGISVSDLSQNAFANLGWTNIELVHPLYVGDTLYAESIVTALRESRSRPYAGIVSCFTRGLNQEGETILTYDRSMMVYKREAGQQIEAFPRAPEPIEAVRARRSH